MFLDKVFKRTQNRREIAQNRAIFGVNPFAFAIGAHFGRQTPCPIREGLDAAFLGGGDVFGAVNHGHQYWMFSSMMFPASSNKVAVVTTVDHGDVLMRMMSNGLALCSVMDARATTGNSMVMTEICLSSRSVLITILALLRGVMDGGR